MAADEIELPPDVTDVARLLFTLSLRGEMWKKMLLGNPKLNITINKQFVDKTSPVKDGDEIALVGFSVV
jgi:molybdopterin synthase sulfur carrier subunit